MNICPIYTLVRISIYATNRTSRVGVGARGRRKRGGDRTYVIRRVGGSVVRRSGDVRSRLGLRPGTWFGDLRSGRRQRPGLRRRFGHRRRQVGARARWGRTRCRRFGRRSGRRRQRRRVRGQGRRAARHRPGVRRQPRPCRGRRLRRTPRCRTDRSDPFARHADVHGIPPTSARWWTLDTSPYGRDRSGAGAVIAVVPHAFVPHEDDRGGRGGAVAPWAPWRRGRHAVGVSLGRRSCGPPRRRRRRCRRRRPISGRRRRRG